MFPLVWIFCFFQVLSADPHSFGENAQSQGKSVEARECTALKKTGLPAPLNVTVISHNFVHTLKWESGPGSPSGTQYRVRIYALNGGNWTSVPSCQNVSNPRECDLTEVFKNIKDNYFASVQAYNDTQESNCTLLDKAFHPIKHTHLDPPSVLLSGCGTCLEVKLIPGRGEEENIIKFYEKLKYNLEIHNTRDGTKFQVQMKGLKKTIDQLESGEKYCITVQILDHISRVSEESCAFTSNLQRHESLIGGMFCFLVVLSLLCVVFFVYTGFLCLPRLQLPITLTSIKIHNKAITSLSVADKCSPICVIEIHRKGGEEKRGSQSSVYCSDCEDSENEEEVVYHHRARHLLAEQPFSEESIPLLEGTLSFTDNDSVQGSEQSCPVQHPCVNVAETNDDSGQATDLIYKPSLDVSEAEISEPLVQSGPEPQKPETECKESGEEAEISLAVNLFSVKLGSQEEAFSMTFQAGAVEDQEQQLEDELIQSPVTVEAVDWGTQEPNTEPSEGPAQTYCSDSEDEEEEDTEPCVYMRR
ncbi:INRA2 protein, partial [Atractosteus spatula]|nr:INRA2 protein [Atractosteus spatula]